MSKSEVHFTRLRSEWRMVCCGVVGVFEFVCIFKIKPRMQSLCASDVLRSSSRDCVVGAHVEHKRHEGDESFTARKLAWKDGQ